MPETPGTLAEALIRLQASLPRITRDDTAQVGQRTYSYANLATITDAVFPRLAELGLYWTCRPTVTVERFVLVYSLTHISGEDISGEYPLPTGTPQTIGGAITYARRYALCAVLGIAPAEDDDDANAQAQAAADRQQMRTRAIADESVHSPPPHARPADRITAADIDREADAWAVAKEDTPGSITGPQLARLGALFGKVGATAREDRLSLAMSLLNLPELATSKDLSFAQAETLARKLQDHITEEGKS